MMQLVCADTGTVCPTVLRAYTRDELMRHLADHLSRDHGVRAPTKTIMDYMAALATEGVDRS